jgi:hypothetical protein
MGKSPMNELPAAAYQAEEHKVVFGLDPLIKNPKP